MSSAWKSISIIFCFVFFGLNLGIHSVAYAGFELGSNSGYYTYAEIEAELDELRATYPTLVSIKEVIGTSIEGRSIYAVKISDNVATDESEPELLYASLIHGNEPMGMQATFYYFWNLLEDYGTDPTATYLINNREFYFIPMINPDGYVANTRKNRRDVGGGSYGVDLNRNFGPQAYWDSVLGGSSTTPSSSTYRGASVFSEPESQAIRDFLTTKHIVAAYSFHSSGKLAIFPYGFSNEDTADGEIFNLWGKKIYDLINFFPGNVIDTVQYNVRGWMADFFYDGDPSRGSIKMMDIEIGDTFAHGIHPATEYIIPLSEELATSNNFLAWASGGIVLPSKYVFNKNAFPAGATASLTPTYQNQGLSSIAATTATLTTNSPYVTIHNGGTQNIDSLASLATMTPSQGFEFSIATNAPSSDQVTLVLKTFLGTAEMSSKNISFYIGSQNSPATGFYDVAKAYNLDGGVIRHSSAAFIDIDNDGDNDVFLINQTGGHSLFQNNGSNQAFTNVTNTYGLNIASDRYQEADWVDVNNDGRLDFFVTSYLLGTSLFINNGPNTPMTDATSIYGLSGQTNTRMTSWKDVNLDGRIDLILGKVADYNKVFINNGPNTPFTDATSTYGLAGDGATNNTTSLAWGDVNNDGLDDLYIVNFIIGESKLYINNGPNTPFTDATSTYGLNVSLPSTLQASWVDVNNDGRRDLFFVVHSGSNKLYINNGPNTPFTDATNTYDLGHTEAVLRKGAYWEDINNDGRLDLFSLTTNPIKVFKNNGQGAAFTDVTTDLNLSNLLVTDILTLASTDANSDGKRDLYLPNYSGENAFFLSQAMGNYLNIQVKNESGRYLPAAKIEVDVDGNGDFSTSGQYVLRDQDYVSNGHYPFQSFPDLVHIGLGDNTHCNIDIRIYLPGVPLGSTPSYFQENICPNQLISFPHTIALQTTNTSSNAAPNDQENCPHFYRYCRNAGPNMINNHGLSTIRPNSHSLSLFNSDTAVLFENRAHHDDLWIDIQEQKTDMMLANNIAFPWEQGLNTASEVFAITAVSAFNGYPITKTNAPFTISLNFNSNTVTQNHIKVSDLKIARFNTKTKRWELLVSPIIRDPKLFVLSTTTNEFGYYAIVYPTLNPQLGAEASMAIFSPTTNLQPLSLPTPMPVATDKKTKQCVFFGLLCW